MTLVTYVVSLVAPQKTPTADGERVFPDEKKPTDPSAAVFSHVVWLLSYAEAALEAIVSLESYVTSRASYAVSRASYEKTLTEAGDTVFVHEKTPIAGDGGRMACETALIEASTSPQKSV